MQMVIYILAAFDCKFSSPGHSNIPKLTDMSLLLFSNQIRQCHDMYIVTALNIQTSVGVCNGGLTEKAA